MTYPASAASLRRSDSEARPPACDVAPGAEATRGARNAYPLGGQNLRGARLPRPPPPPPPPPLPRVPAACRLPHEEQCLSKGEGMQALAPSFTPLPIKEAPRGPARVLSWAVSGPSWGPFLAVLAPPWGL